MLNKKQQGNMDLIKGYENFLADQVANNFTENELPTELHYGEDYNDEETRSIIKNLDVNDDNYHLLTGLSKMVDFKYLIGINDNKFQFKKHEAIDFDFIEELRELLEDSFFGVTIEPKRSGFNLISIELY